MNSFAGGAEPPQHHPAADAAVPARVQRWVAGAAPRLFAVVQQRPGGADARIAAWGMAFDDHATAVTVDGTALFSLTDARDAVRGFDWSASTVARLVWVAPAADPGRSPVEP